MDKLTVRLDTTFTMVSCLSTNTVSGVEWYVGNGSSRQMTPNRSTFFKLEEQDIDMHVELGDDGRHLVVWFGSISFCMQAGEVWTYMRDD